MSGRQATAPVSCQLVRGRFLQCLRLHRPDAASADLHPRLRRVVLVFETTPADS